MAIKTANGSDLRNSLSSGLVLLNTTTFSAVASQSISNFTSTSYTRYKIIFTCISSTDGTSLQFRFRENLTDKTTGYYGAGYQAVYTTSVGLFTNENNGSKCVLSNGDNTGNGSIILDFFRSADTNGVITGQSYDFNAGSAIFFGFTNTGLTNVTGVTFYPAAGTITGKVAVYGYNE